MNEFEVVTVIGRQVEAAADNLKALIEEKAL